MKKPYITKILALIEVRNEADSKISAQLEAATNVKEAIEAIPGVSLELRGGSSRIDNGEQGEVV